jgi:hypothetical protein
VADLLKCSSPFITKWKDWCFYTAHCLTSIKGRNELCILLRDRPFNLHEGAMVFFRTTRVRIFFPPEFNIRLYDKNSESDYFFFPPPKSEYFFSNSGNQNIFLEKNITPPPPFQVKWSFPKVCALLDHQKKRKKNHDGYIYPLHT